MGGPPVGPFREEIIGVSSVCPRIVPSLTPSHLGKMEYAGSLAYDVSAKSLRGFKSEEEQFMNCNGCGVELDPSEEQVNASVDQILETSLKDADKKGGVCPLCGHSKDVPYSHRKAVLFGLLLACLLISIAAGIVVHNSQQTQRTAVANDAVARMTNNPDVVKFLGKPITIRPGIQGEVKQDETGWKEAHLTIPVHGPNGEAIVYVIGGHAAGPWVFTTFEVDFEKQHQKVDLVSGRVVEYDPNTYVDVHTQTAAVPQYTNTVAAEARFDGEFPCVFASVGAGNVIPQLGKCAMPTQHTGAIDRFEIDLRNGNFVLRQSDLYLKDVFEVPLTRSYRSYDWVSTNPVHAFGRNANHPFDIAPIGTRNPYTYQMIVLEDGDFLYFDRISKGTGYADSVFQHTETSTRFYKAIERWNGSGWTTKLTDGSEIHFPESYNARNLAQGAPTEMRDADGNRLELHRDSQRNLQEIRTPHGHGIKFSYDDLSRITRAEDDAGNWARYEYNSEGMLTSSTLSSGRERHYDYDGAHMTRIADENGRVLLRNWYQREVVIRQGFANGAIYQYAYDWAPDRYYPDRVVITLPDFTKQVVRVSDSVAEFVLNYHHR
jgi:YD repeat-containing protein